MPPTTAVCFDLDNTILSYDQPYEAIVREGLGPHCDDLTDAMVETAMIRLLEALEALEESPYHTATAAAIEGDAGAAAADLDTLVESLQTAELEGTSVAEPARDSLATLAADFSVVVCLLTVGHDDWQRRKLAHHDVDGHFAHVVTSYDAGGTKESGAPYDAVRERVDADEYVMIGDDYAADVEAARDAGFVPIHYEATDGPDFFATLKAML